jgi:hypothetical protein
MFLLLNIKSSFRGNIERSPSSLDTPDFHVLVLGTQIWHILKLQYTLS